MTFKAIELRSKYNNEFKGEKFATKEIWKKIASEMGFEDIAMGAKVLAKKWDNLLQKYKRMKIGNRQSENGSLAGGCVGGVGSVDKTPESWIYYQKMDELLGQRHNIVPPIIVSSLDEIPDGNSEINNNTNANSTGNGQHSEPINHQTVNIDPYDIHPMIQDSSHDYVIRIDTSTSGVGSSEKRHSRKRQLPDGDHFRQTFSTTAGPAGPCGSSTSSTLGGVGIKKRKREDIEIKMSRFIDESIEVMKSLGESMQQTSSAICALVNLLSKLIDKSNPQNEDELFL